MDFSDIKGHENIKRAIEIAVLGFHSITVIPVRGHGHSMLSMAMDTLNRAVNPPARGDAFLNSKSLDVDIIMQMSPISPNEFFTYRKTESNIDVMERIKRAQDVQLKHTSLDDTCITLAKTAMDRMNLTPKQMSIIMKVAITIARLDGDNSIKAHHVAEAIQYQMPNIDENSK